jgi:hypothetical protein
LTFVSFFLFGVNPMPAQNVDLVLVIDASSSMKPCFDALRDNLTRLVAPLQGFVTNVQFCVLAQSVGMRGRTLVHDHRFIGTSGADALDALYAGPANQGVGRGPFFTADTGRVRSFLADLKPEGNEDLLLALDLAADLPFGPITSTCRVIALFSDEPIEAGAVESGRVERIPELIEKLTRRRIKLFAALTSGTANNLNACLGPPHAKLALPVFLQCVRANNKRREDIFPVILKLL